MMLNYTHSALNTCITDLLVRFDSAFNKGFENLRGIE